MKALRFSAIFTIFFTVVFSFTRAQAPLHKCGTMDHMEKLIARDPGIYDRMQQIEAQTRQYLESDNAKSGQTLVTIPVVVHVIHYGETEETGRNISDAQVYSQIASLNEDYRLLNEDSLMPSHPFWQYTADCKIEFCLAQQDPNGDPTSGITRHEGTQPSWDEDEIETYIKPPTVWDPSSYLNMWTVDFGGADSNLLGYAQFPGGPDSTDGVVIRYTAFGREDNVEYPNDMGRTATHEVGHYLNLYHIWGDEYCGDDLVGDTESAEEANYGCPGFPHNDYNGCGTGANGEMYMNYMDYTDDACMVMFTFGQKDRMQAILANDRYSLQYSSGCTPAGIAEVMPAKLSNVSLYPNPNAGSFSLAFHRAVPGMPEISIFNSLGQQISSFDRAKTENGFRVQMKDCPEGLYFVKIRLGEEKVMKKVFIYR